MGVFDSWFEEPIHPAEIDADIKEAGDTDRCRTDRTPQERKRTSSSDSAGAEEAAGTSPRSLLATGYARVGPVQDPETLGDASF